MEHNIERRMAAVIYEQAKEVDNLTQLVNEQRHFIGDLANDLQRTQERLNEMEVEAENLVGIYEDLYKVHFNHHPKGRSYGYESMLRVLRGTQDDELRDSSCNCADGTARTGDGRRSDFSADERSAEVSQGAGVLR